MSKKQLTNLQKHQRLERSRRATRMRKIKKYRPLCINRRFIEYAYREGCDNETVDAAALIMHRFFILRKKVSSAGWLPIPYETFEGMFGMDYKRIRDNLIASGFLEEDEIRGYKKGSHCTFYRICNELQNSQIKPLYYLKSDNLQKIFIKNKDKWKRMSQAKRQEADIAKIRKDCMIPSDDCIDIGTKESYYELVRQGYLTIEQLKTIERLASNAQLLRVKITDAEFSEIAKMRYAKKERSEKDNYDVDAYEQRGREKLERLDFTIDEYGRFYTGLTGMYRELWDYTYFRKQQLVAVDVKTSHVVCILALIRDIEINYFGNTGSHEERLSKCQFDKQIRMTPSLIGHLCRTSDIYPAYSFFEFRKRLPDDLIERRKIMYELFKKFTKLQVKSIHNVYRRFEHYLYRNFNEGVIQRNMSHYLSNDKIENYDKFTITHDHNSLHSDNIIGDSKMNNQYKVNNNYNHEVTNVLNISDHNSLQNTSNTPIPNTPNLYSGVIASTQTVGVGMQNQLHQQVMNNLRACRFSSNYGSNPDKSTDDIPVFRNLFFPCPEEIAEFEQIVAGDIYTLLMDSIGIDRSKRDQFKEDFFRFLYRPAFSQFNEKVPVLREDGTWTFKGIPDPVRQSMETLVPSIVFFIDICKCQPGTLKRKGTDYKKVPHLILRIESQIMLETCANLWKKYPNMFLTTKHDAIKCLPKDVMKVQEELKRTFEKYHVSPKFEVKHHKRPSDHNG